MRLAHAESVSFSEELTIHLEHGSEGVCFADVSVELKLASGHPLGRKVSSTRVPGGQITVKVLTMPSWKWLIGRGGTAVGTTMLQKTM